MCQYFCSLLLLTPDKQPWAGSRESSVHLLSAGILCYRSIPGGMSYHTYKYHGICYGIPYPYLQSGLDPYIGSKPDCYVSTIYLSYIYMTWHHPFCKYFNITSMPGEWWNDHLYWHNLNLRNWHLVETDTFKYLWIRFSQLSMSLILSLIPSWRKHVISRIRICEIINQPI